MKKLTLTIICSFLFFGLYSQVNLDSGLVAFYPLDGNAQDAGPNGLHGNLFGAQNDTNRHGELNKALRFDGSNDFISIAHNSLLNLTGNKTISFWYKFTGSTSNLYPHLIYKYGQSDYATYAVFLPEDPAYGSNKQKVAFMQGKTTNVNTHAYTKQNYRQYLNQWINITASYSTADGYMRIYFNGQISDSAYAGSFTSPTSTDSLQIGRGSDYYGSYKGQYFTGVMDDIRLYNRAISAAEVSQLYTFDDDTTIVCHHYDTISVYDTTYVNVYDTIAVLDTLCGSQIDLDNGLIAYYPLDGNALDAGPHNLHGNLVGAQNDTNRYGEANKALKFDGANDFINVAHNNLFNLTGDKTVSLWYKITDSVLNAYPILLYKYGQGDFPTYGVFFTEDPVYGANKQKVAFIQGNSSNVNAHAYTQQKYRQYYNQWVNITASYSTADGYMRVYFNGQLSGSTYIPSLTSSTSTDSLQIGRGSDYYGTYKGSYFTGLMDDIRLYNRAITPAEALQLYNGVDSSSGVCHHYDTISVYDSSYVNVYDTIYINVYDTISVYDTTHINVYDSIAVTDTLIINLTVLSSPTPSINIIKIFPNPTTNILTIDYGSPSLLIGYKLLIIDNLGQTVHNTLITQATEQIDLSTYSKGLYNVLILDDTGNIIEHRKIVLQ